MHYVRITGNIFNLDFYYLCVHQGCFQTCERDEKGVIFRMTYNTPRDFRGYLLKWF